jgi:hypothetical protein
MAIPFEMCEFGGVTSWRAGKQHASSATTARIPGTEANVTRSSGSVCLIGSSGATLTIALAPAAVLSGGPLLDILGLQALDSLCHSRRVMLPTIELLQGTLDVLILKAISLGPLHGYGVLPRIQRCPTTS